MKNISFDGSTVTIQSDSRLLILADVAALEGFGMIARTNPSLGQLARTELSRLLSSARSGFRAYVHDLGSVPAGPVEISYSDLEVADGDDTDSATVDTGALVVLDASKLDIICEVLTWQAYDHALRVADSSRFDALTKKIGGPYFGILHGDADASHCFHGDGAYKIKIEKKAP
jgi:hypothetical protein